MTTDESQAESTAGTSTSGGVPHAGEVADDGAASSVGAAATDGSAVSVASEGSSDVPVGDEEPRDHGLLSSQEALERIERGEVLRGVRIEDLRLTGCSQPVRMEGVTLLRPQLRGIFEEEVVFQGCKLISPKWHYKTTFRKTLSFRSSELINASFRKLTVEGVFSMENLHTRAVLRLAGCDFQDEIKAWGAQFGGWFDFKYCTCHQLVDFRSIQAEEGISLDDSNFCRDVLVRGATVTKKFDCAGATFQGLLDLSKAKLHDFVYLEDITQGPEHTLALANAIAERILIRPEQVEGRLASEKNKDYVTACREYGLLQRSFQALQRYEEEDWALYRFKVSYRRSRSRPWYKPWRRLSQAAEWVFLDLACGYGTNPFRAVLAGGLMILLFAIIYMVGYDHFDNVKPLVDSTVDSWQNRVTYGLVTSVSMFTAGFTGDQLYHARGWVLLPLATEALLGTLLWGFFIVAFSRKVIR